MDNYMKMATFNYPDTLPFHLGLLPATWREYGVGLEEVALRHPACFPGYNKGDYVGRQNVSGLYVAGKKTDEWGCVWDSIVEGYDSVCLGHPVPRREDILTLKAPEVDAGTPHGFMFLRLTYLRGYEECMADFGEECPELQMLIDIVCDYNCRQIDIMLANMKPEHYQIGFGDDLGMQNMLPTGPVKWRKYLKPAFTKMYKPCKDAGKLVYMHTDGCIWEIIPDLKDSGVDIVNPQYRANGLDNLKAACRGEGRYKIAMYLDLDRQMFPFSTVQEIEDHVMECVEVLGSREGGLALSAECAADVSLEKIEAICNALEKPSVYFPKKTI